MAHSFPYWFNLVFSHDLLQPFHYPFTYVFPKQGDNFHSMVARWSSQAQSLTQEIGRISRPQALAVQKLWAASCQIISIDYLGFWTALSFCPSCRVKAELHLHNCIWSVEGKYYNQHRKLEALETGEMNSRILSRGESDVRFLKFNVYFPHIIL